MIRIQALDLFAEVVETVDALDVVEVVVDSRAQGPGGGAVEASAEARRPAGPRGRHARRDPPVAASRGSHIGAVRISRAFLDRHRNRGLLLGAVAGHPPSPDLAPVRHEPAQQVDVLVVDVLDPLLA